ncbi:hypothetical protein NECAME_15814 [Necator americanus]|uniref:Uncharacterized protein n=1 Tax=Necator americanus TaxID=51031 RepID=W2SI79_NECAM|nr:hypothetical protein NECAME_15814 [Necator americanus]ETN68462.1 hypothetical protein NECAME_15814 [Necator americanus]
MFCDSLEKTSRRSQSPSLRHIESNRRRSEGDTKTSRTSVRTATTSGSHHKLKHFALTLENS